MKNPGMLKSFVAKKNRANNSKKDDLTQEQQFCNKTLFLAKKEY